MLASLAQINHADKTIVKKLTEKEKIKLRPKYAPDPQRQITIPLSWTFSEPTNDFRADRERRFPDIYKELLEPAPNVLTQILYAVAKHSTFALLLGGTRVRESKTSQTLRQKLCAFAQRAQDLKRFLLEHREFHSQNVYVEWLNILGAIDHLYVSTPTAKPVDSAERMLSILKDYARQTGNQPPTKIRRISGARILHDCLLDVPATDYALMFFYSEVARRRLIKKLPMTQIDRVNRIVELFPRVPSAVFNSLERFPANSNKARLIQTLILRAFDNSLG